MDSISLPTVLTLLLLNSHDFLFVLLSASVRGKSDHPVPLASCEATAEEKVQPVPCVFFVSIRAVSK